MFVAAVEHSEQMPRFEDCAASLVELAARAAVLVRDDRLVASRRDVDEGEAAERVPKEEPSKHPPHDVLGDDDRSSDRGQLCGFAMAVRAKGGLQREHRLAILRNACTKDGQCGPAEGICSDKEETAHRPNLFWATPPRSGSEAVGTRHRDEKATGGHSNHQRVHDLALEAVITLQVYATVRGDDVHRENGIHAR
jgi:hypothetical protein